MKAPRPLLAALLGFELLACGPKAGASDSGSESGTQATSDATQTATTVTATTATPTTAGPTTTATETGTTGTTDTTASATTVGPDPTTGTTTSATTAACDMVSATAASTSMTGTGGTTDGQCADTPDQPDDSPCSDASGCGCASGKCYIVPALGGYCGECLGDADCGGGGCTVPNVIAGVGSKCNDGGPGDGCQSDAVCKDPSAPLCKLVLDVPGILAVATCSACRSNADCPDPALHNCSPDYDLAGFAGQYTCKADGSLPNNSGCNLADCLGEPLGDRACASGHCGEATVMGLLKLGICGECNGDADCDPGLACSDPLVDLQTTVLLGSVCQ